MIKLPEPVGNFHALNQFFDVDAPTEYEKSIGWEAIYTEAQLKQAVRDAYEDAASVVDNADSPDCGGWNMTHIAERIRALVKEVV